MAGSDLPLVRARDERGQFVADDPRTPDVNEAWVEVVTEDGGQAG